MVTVANVSFNYYLTNNQESNAHKIHVLVNGNCCQCVCKKMTQNIKRDLNLTIPIAMKIVTIRIDMKV